MAASCSRNNTGRGIRKPLAERHSWLHGAIVKALKRSKSIALAPLADTFPTEVTLPFGDDQLRKARTLMGQDF